METRIFPVRSQNLGQAIERPAAAIFRDESDAFFFQRSPNRANAARGNVAARFLNNFQQTEPCRFRRLAALR